MPRGIFKCIQTTKHPSIAVLRACAAACAPGSPGVSLVAVSGRAARFSAGFPVPHDKAVMPGNGGLPVWAAMPSEAFRRHFCRLFQYSAECQNGCPTVGVLAWALVRASTGPASNASRPDSTASAKARAMLTGSPLRETAVFNNTPSKPHSITCAAWEGKPKPASIISGVSGRRSRRILSA